MVGNYLNEMKTITIATDFSDTPLGRYPDDGAYNGEAFRENFLVPALRDSPDGVKVVMDGVEGFGSSFLDEAFGGLVRNCGFEKAFLKARLHLQASPENLLYVNLIWKYIDRAKPSQSTRAS